MTDDAILFAAGMSLFLFVLVILGTIADWMERRA